MVFHSFSEVLARLDIGKRRTAVVAAAHDAHALEAVLHAARQGLIDYRLVGDAVKIRGLGQDLGVCLPEDCIVNTATDEESARAAVALIAAGRGDFLMKGQMPTATLLQAVVHPQNGIRTGGLMSHVALLEIPGYPKLLALTDGGMVISPTLEEKRHIVENAVALLRAFGYDRPKVAALAAVEEVHPKMSATLDAAALQAMGASGELADCLVEGPISFDLMYSAQSAAIKGYHSALTGDTDILLVPDMTAGNLLCKAMIYTAGARMAGLIVGAKVPIVLTSRGADAEEKYLSLAAAAVVGSTPAIR